MLCTLSLGLLTRSTFMKLLVVLKIQNPGSEACARDKCLDQDPSLPVNKTFFRVCNCNIEHWTSTTPQRHNARRKDKLPSRLGTRYVSLFFVHYPIPNGETGNIKVGTSLIPQGADLRSIRYLQMKKRRGQCFMTRLLLKRRCSIGIERFMCMNRTAIARWYPWIHEG